MTAGQRDAQGTSGLLARWVAYRDGIGYGLMGGVLFLAPFLALIALSLAILASTFWLTVNIGRLLGIPSNMFTAIIAIIVISAPIQFLFRGMARRVTDFYKKNP